MRKILVVDDEIGIRELLSEILIDEGYTVELAENAAAARAYRNHTRPDLVLLDIWMPDTDGITLLKEWVSSGLLTMPVVMMSGHGTIDTAVEATRIGAHDFLEKPIALQKLLLTVNRAISRSEQRPHFLEGPVVIGRSNVVQELKQRLERIANFRAPVLLEGAPGCGYEACARLLHSPNSAWKIIDHEMQGLDAPLDILQAHRGGTLFIRNIAELDKTEQRALYILLSQAERHNVRIICGSVTRIASLVSEGVFDDRIYQILGGHTIQLPKLRDQQDDIPEIAAVMLQEFIIQKKLTPRQFSTAALNALRLHTWPGNFTELSNVVLSLANIAQGELISAEEVQGAIPKEEVFTNGTVFSLEGPLRDTRDAFERAYFEHHLARENGNISRVAEVAGLERTHLYRKLKQLGINSTRKND